MNATNATNGSVSEMVRFTRWADGKGTVLDTGEVTARTKRDGRRDRLTVRNRQGEEYQTQDHPDFVLYERDWSPLWQEAQESRAGTTVATTEGAVIAQTEHHTITY